ncbi:MAG: hypothetical protein II036_03380 [Oscillospiraceae bacterium]|nr:hypothetical protein [Oscillospiraceae bacterium]
MTREEALKFLKLMRKAVSNFEEYGHDKASMVIECDKAEAIDMAIEALSADTVSREAHYDAVANRITDMEERGFVSVVRCKDCRHRDLFSCPLADNDFQKDDDFCSWGERREE